MADPIRALGVTLYTIPLYPLKAVAHVGMTLFSGKPMEVQYYSDARFHRLALSLHRQERFDVVVSFFYAYCTVCH